MKCRSVVFVCLVAAIAAGASVPAADGVSVPVKCEISFARGKWNPDDFIPVKSWRNAYVGRFDQRDDAIVNACPDLPGVEIFKKHCSDVYAAMVYKKKIPFGATVSSRMAFDHRMAPLIVLAPVLEANAAGQIEFREHWEIVFYDCGLNVWHHYFEDGKQKWIKSAAFELPKGTGFEKDKPCNLVVKTQFNSRGRKEMVVQCGGYTLSYADDKLPSEFFAGIVGCEGRNFFYDFRIE